MKSKTADSLASDDKRKVAFTIKEAARASGLSRSLLYIAIGRGALRARKCGARTLILDADLRQFLRKLPNFRANAAADINPKQNAVA
jgi:excisionase family DNA binding protein